MRRIIIYEREGRLTLRESASEELDITERLLKDQEAIKYLNNLTQNNKMRNVQVIKNPDGSEGLNAELGNFSVQLSDSDKLNKYEKQLSPFVNKAVEVLQKQRILEIKRKRTAEGHTEPPKVTRDNKYMNFKIAAAAIAITTLLATYIPNFVEPIEDTDIGSKEIGEDVVDTIANFEDNYDFFNVELTEKVSDSDINEHSSQADYGHNSDQAGMAENMDFSVSDVINDTSSQGTISITYEDRSSDLKLETTKELYGATIEKYANQYGLDPNLVLAVATQERGVHSSVIDSEGGFGLMQIQKSIWENKDVTAYNFETEEEETIRITENGMADLDTNIQYGCMILSHMMKVCDYNIPAGISSYNFGDAAIRNVMRICASETGTTFDTLMNDPNNYSWLDYRSQNKYGDAEYLENVVSYMGPEFNTYVMRADGTKVECSFKSNEIAKSY